MVGRYKPKLSHLLFIQMKSQMNRLIEIIIRIALRKIYNNFIFVVAVSLDIKRTKFMVFNISCANNIILPFNIYLQSAIKKDN